MGKTPRQIVQVPILLSKDTKEKKNYISRLLNKREHCSIDSTRPRTSNMRLLFSYSPVTYIYKKKNIYRTKTILTLN